MTCVVLGGSRHISRLSDEVQARLARLVQLELRVIVGDANGADKALQQELSKQGHRLVEVFCSGNGSPRNNVGRWPCRHIATSAKPGTFEFYAAKDQAMALEASVGFMIWDGASVGTMLNVWRLLQQKKTTLLWAHGAQAFLELRDRAGWERLLALATAEARVSVEKRILSEHRTAPGAELPLFGA